MSRLRDATLRLEQAVDRLEGAAAKVLDADGAEGLAAELASARREYEVLSRTTNEVSDKLDRAIGRLKLVLES